MPVTSKTPLKLSGFTQIRSVNATGVNTPSTLEARRVRLTLAGDATPDVDYRAQLDFAGSRKAVTDTTFQTGVFGKPVLLEAWIGFRLPWQDKLTLGQQKVPFGLENLTSSTNFDLINYAQVTDALVPGRDNGAQGTTRNRTGVDTTLLADPWTLRSEYIWGTDAAVQKRGWYATVTRNLTPTVQAVARVDQLDPNTAVAENATTALTGGFTWLLSKDGLTRIQLNYEHKREQGAQVPNDQTLAQGQTGF